MGEVADEGLEALDERGGQWVLHPLAEVGVGEGGGGREGGGGGKRRRRRRRRERREEEREKEEERRRASCVECGVEEREGVEDRGGDEEVREVGRGRMGREEDGCGAGGGVRAGGRGSETLRVVGWGAVAGVRVSVGWEGWGMGGSGAEEHDEGVEEGEGEEEGRGEDEEEGEA